MYDGRLNFIDGIGQATVERTLEAYHNTHRLLEYYGLACEVRDAWYALKDFSDHACDDGNHLVQNLNRAEQLVRNFLFAFRTCLDHMQTAIRQDYEDDCHWQAFHAATSAAYDGVPEYAFVSHLRNCAQHCRNVVHGFHGTTGIRISSNRQTLQRVYDRWKPVDMDFMAGAGEEIDLMGTIERAFNAFHQAMIQVIRHFMETDGAGADVMYLRSWGEALDRQFGHGVHCYHIAQVHENGTVDAYSPDWNRIFDLTDRCESRPAGA